MRNDTREKMAAYLRRVASLNNVASATEKFSVAPAVQQKLENKVQHSSSFLREINNISVTEQSGINLGLGIGSTIASTVDSQDQDRVPIDPTGLSVDDYVCTQTNFDTYLTYEKLDAWSKFQDFELKIRDSLLKRQALDIIMIGFNGVQRAATSDREANPLLQDVNVGWLQKYRDHSPGRVVSGIKIGPSIGIAEGYRTLDALVYDGINTLLDPWFASDADLVAIVATGLMADVYFPMINKTQTNVDRLALDLIISSKQIAGRRVIAVPNFPDDKIFVTRLDNLSRYYQDNSRRRHIVDNPKRDRVENYESSNDAFVVEDYGSGFLFENIEIIQ